MPAATARRCLRTLEELGYMTRNELAYGLVAVAVPVLGRDSRIVAALNSSGHSKRMGKCKLFREPVPILQAVSRKISDEIARISGLGFGSGL